MLYPHERSLVQKYQGRAFALLGVNLEGDREKARRAVADNKLTWRNFWVPDPDDPVHERYGVVALPTTYVLDPGGVVRYKSPDPEEVDRAVQMLLQELETAGKS